ncbi:MAG: iron chelate uptake ABC transporter family permease subunit, partial [Campylobacterota bacterium]|nr:iron chelate uptake ABC transporter family permease subunit [Campylobacterota bacterium]
MSKFFLWFLLLLILFVSPFIGAVALDISDVFRADSLQHSIFFELRLPRVLFAFFAGSILALSGLLFQTLFRNA